jgi:hypothetical protein
MGMPWCEIYQMECESADTETHQYHCQFDNGNCDGVDIESDFIGNADFDL